MRGVSKDGRTHSWFETREDALVTMRGRASPTVPLVGEGRVVAACAGLAQHRDMHEHATSKL